MLLDKNILKLMVGVTLLGIGWNQLSSLPSNYSSLAFASQIKQLSPQRQAKKDMNNASYGNPYLFFKHNYQMNKYNQKKYKKALTELINLKRKNSGVRETVNVFFNNLPNFNKSSHMSKIGFLNGLRNSDYNKAIPKQYRDNLIFAKAYLKGCKLADNHKVTHFNDLALYYQSDGHVNSNKLVNKQLSKITNILIKLENYEAENATTEKENERLGRKALKSTRVNSFYKKQMKNEINIQSLSVNAKFGINVYKHSAFHYNINYPKDMGYASGNNRGYDGTLFSKYNTNASHKTGRAFYKFFNLYMESSYNSGSGIYRKINREAKRYKKWFKKNYNMKVIKGASLPTQTWAYDAQWISVNKKYQKKSAVTVIAPNNIFYIDEKG